MMKLSIVEALSLCQRCSYGVVMSRRGDSRGNVLGRTATFCQSIGTFVPSDIAECNRYNPINQRPLSAFYDVASMALNVDTRPEPGQTL